jgi:DNA-binding response OmpR family regulator
LKILLLEDEMMLRTSIKEYLSELGYFVTCFADGSKANEDLLINRYDLLLLDINVPNIDGLELLKKRHQEQDHTPTIFISANTDIDIISDAFDLGAIDYLKKPFHLKELGIRIQKEIDIIQSKQVQVINVSKNYCFSMETNTLFYNKEPQQLTNKKLQIIRCLASNVGIVINIDTFREYIWDNEPVSDATIRTELNRLKKVLKEDFIKNIKGVGYLIEKYSPNI